MTSGERRVERHCLRDGVTPRRPRAKHPQRPWIAHASRLGVSPDVFDHLRRAGVVVSRTNKLRPLPQHGPFAVVDGEVLLPIVWSKFDQRYVEVRVSGADYSLVLRRRWRLDKARYPCSTFWNPDEKRHGIVLLHRLIAHATDDLQVDHVHHDLLDCRRESLRLATPTQNTANRRRPAANGTSRYRGVTRSTATKSIRWQAQAAGYIGLFKCELQAAKAYDEIARKKWGAFARTNFDLEGKETAEVASLTRDRDSAA